MPVTPRYGPGYVTANCTGPTPIVNPFDGTLSIVPGICSSSGGAGSSKTVSVRTMSLEVLLSSYPIESIGFNEHAASSYFNADVHTFSGVDLDKEFGFGVGIVLPFSQGEADAGLDIIDESLIGFGLRYYLK